MLNLYCSQLTGHIAPLLLHSRMIRTVSLMFSKSLIYGGVIMAQYGFYATLQVDRGMVQPTELNMSVENFLRLPDNCAKARSTRETTGWDRLVNDLKKEELVEDLNKGGDEESGGEDKVSPEDQKDMLLEFDVDLGESNHFFDDFNDYENSDNESNKPKQELSKKHEEEPEENPEMESKPKQKLSEDQKEELEKNPEKEVFETLTSEVDSYSPRKEVIVLKAGTKEGSGLQ